MSMDLKIRPWLGFCISIILAGFFGFICWYMVYGGTAPIYSGNQSVSEKTPTPLPNKEYVNGDLKVSFNYPADWKDIVLEKYDFSDPVKSIYYSNKRDEYYDPQKIFTFVLDSKVSQSFEWPVFNKKKVDVNWSADEFKEEMGIDGSNILLAKKLSDKSMLVAIYSSPECSPTLKLSVLAPLNDDIPNFQVVINDHFENDPEIVAYAHNQAENQGDSCDLLEGYEKITKKISDNNYSKDLTAYIKTAQTVADSVRTINE